MQHVLSRLLVCSVVACTGSNATEPAVDAGPDPDDPPGDAGRDPDPDPDPGLDAGLPPDGGTLPAGCSWRTFQIGTTPWAGNGVALAVSATGEHAVMFEAILAGRRDLVVGRLSGTTVTVQPYGLTLIPNSSTGIAGVFGSGGALHIAYTNQQDNSSTNGGLSYSAGPGQSVFLDGAGLFGSVGTPAAALGGDGKLRIAYVVFNGAFDRRVAVATGSGTAFSIQAALIDNRLVNTPTIALDAAGRAHVIVEQFENPVFHVSEVGTGWSAPDLVMADGGFAFSGSMAIAADGTIQLSRRDSGQIIRAHGTANAWQSERLTHAAAQVGPDPGALAATVDHTGRLFVAWADTTGRRMFVTELGKAPVEVPVTIAAGTRIREIAATPSPDGVRIAFTAAPQFGEPREVFTSRCE
ncbi:MAG: hypothetical protein ABI867_36065 [Kofleriaceae bacterium]